MRQRCKIANSEEGMEKLMDHTLRRQMAEMKTQMNEMTKMMQALVGQAIVPAQQSTTIMTGPVDQRIVDQRVVDQRIVDQRSVQHQQINIEKIEIRPWDSSRAITVDIAEIVAAFAENTRLKEYANLPGPSFIDPDVAPPYVTELFTDLVRRGHADPASRNIYLNPRRADQVLVHLRSGSWEVRPAQEGYRALLDGVATSVHGVTLSTEKRQLLPTEAQNALAMAGLLYDGEPEEYVKRAKASLTAHLMNLTPAALPPPQ